MHPTFALLLSFWIAEPAAQSADVVIYGGTPAGIAAAWAAADDGRSVLLIEPTARLGGMVTCGLSHADFRTFESLTGAYWNFAGRVAQFYERKYGPDSPQARQHFRGTHAEPKVNLAVFEAMLAERPRIVVLRAHRLRSVTQDDRDRRRRITSLTLTDDRGRESAVEGKVFIDAAYEGDLLAAAGVDFRVGREGRDEFDEPLAPPTPDGKLQGYNFRLTMTSDPANQAPVRRPDGYRREAYVDVLPMLHPKKIVRVFGREGEPVIFKTQTPGLPNAKTDINDVSHGAVRLSLPSENLTWPTGDVAARRAVFDEHLRWNVGLLYFLQNDDAVPAAYRADARRWAFCRDEYVETDHIPPQLYIREARRMQGTYVFTERDCNYADDDARAVLHADAIAAGDYGPNCHGTDHEGSRFGGRHTGEFYKPVAAYQIPYGVLTPKDVTNLLVSTAVSSSHVGFCALRLEPIWMSLGQAAGHAAALAAVDGTAVQDVSVAQLQERLHADRSATIYVSDVGPAHADFAAVQWWGTDGGLHGLYPSPKKPGERGPHIVGQYYQAFPGHAAELDLPLTEKLAERWKQLATKRGVPLDKLPVANGSTTRGDWIRAAYSNRPRQDSDACIDRRACNPRISLRWLDERP